MLLRMAPDKRGYQKNINDLEKNKVRKKISLFGALGFQDKFPVLLQN